MPHVVGAVAGLLGPFVGDGLFQKFLSLSEMSFHEFVESDVEVRVEETFLFFIVCDIRVVDSIENRSGCDLSREQSIDIAKGFAIIFLVAKQFLPRRHCSFSAILRQITPDAVLSVDVIERMISIKLTGSF